MGLTSQTSPAEIARKAARRGIHNITDVAAGLDPTGQLGGAITTTGDAVSGAVDTAAGVADRLLGGLGRHAPSPRGAAPAPSAPAPSAAAPGVPSVDAYRRAPDNVISPVGMPGETAYDLISSELLLDGSARLNLATFVTTWMPPYAARLMAETADKNMIDKDEYPQTAELEKRCVNMIGRLWNIPGSGDVTGTST